MGPAKMARPFALDLVVAHFEEASGGVEQETQCVFRDGTIVQTGSVSDDDFCGIKACVGDIVGPGRERLDPSHVLHAFDRIVQVGRLVRPSDEDLSIDEMVWKRNGDVIGLKLYGETFEFLCIELQ